jgi:hypothetical protein
VLTGYNADGNVKSITSLNALTENQTRQYVYPSITALPNGDLMAIWYACVDEPGFELAIAASRLRPGAEKWD